MKDKMIESIIALYENCDICLYLGILVIGGLLIHLR